MYQIQFLLNATQPQPLDRSKELGPKIQVRKYVPDSGTV